MESYHPKRKRNEILDRAEMEGILSRGNHITIALARGNEPYVVTLSYGYDKENRRLYFHCANKGDKLDFLRANPKVCATVIEDRGYLPTRCEHDYASLVIRGEMRIVDELAEKKHGLQVLLNHLEADPQPIFERNIKDDKSYDNVTMLRLDADAVVGKKYVRG